MLLKIDEFQHLKGVLPPPYLIVPCAFRSQRCPEKTRPAIRSVKTNHNGLKNGQPTKDAYVLKRTAYPFLHDLICPELQKLFPVVVDSASDWLVETRYSIEGACLSRPVRSYKTEYLTAIDME